MSLYDRTDQINRRLKVLNLAVKLWLANHPSAKKVRMRHIQEALIDYFNSIKEPIPNWVFSSNWVGRLLKTSGYSRHRKPQYVSYELEASHADKILSELDQINKEIQKSRIDLPKYLQALVEFKVKCAKEANVKPFEPLSFRKQLKLAETMLAHLNKLEPQKYRDLLRISLQKTIQILKESMAKMPTPAQYRKSLKETQAFKRAHEGKI